MIRAAIVALLVCGTAQAATYQVASGSQVSFLAHITGSTFTATNKAVSGSVTTDDNGVVTQGAVVLDAKAFETGMGMRDGHMRDKYLEADKCPRITLDLTGAKLLAGGAGVVDVDGTMDAHCVKKPVKLHVAVIKKGDAFEANSTFPINVTDYGIAQPKFAVVKMETVVEVTTVIRFTLAP